MDKRQILIKFESYFDFNTIYIMLNKGYREDESLSSAYIPLAERLRPRTLDDYVGQEHLVGKD